MQSKTKLILGVPGTAESAAIYFSLRCPDNGIHDDSCSAASDLSIVSRETQKVEAKMSEEQYLAIQNRLQAVLLAWLESQPDFVNFPSANEIAAKLKKL